MIDRILAILRGSTAQTLPPADEQHLLGALMVRVARADGAYVLAEIEVMDRLIGATFSLDALGAAKLRAECEKLEAAMPPTDEVIVQIHATIAPQNRKALLDALHKVSKADGQKHPQELAVIKTVAAVLAGS